MLKKKELKIFSATSFVGHGVDKKSLERAIEYDLDFIIAQGTTTDAGPYYLGAGKPVMAEEALRRDLELIITIAKGNNVPFIVSAGGSGTDSTTELVLELIEEICQQHALNLRLGIVLSEIDPEYLVTHLENGKKAKRIVPHPALKEYLSIDDVRGSSRIVAQAGPEVVMALWQNTPGLDGIVCGRSLDVGLYAAMPLLHGFDKGLSMHFGKIMEDGALAATPGSGNDGLLGIIREDHFEVKPTNPARKCTPESVTGHAFYERFDPAREANPGGNLDVSLATYTQVAEDIVRVQGAKWIAASEYTVKLEGAAHKGFRSICIAGVRDPRVIKNVDLILEESTAITRDYFSYLPQSDYSLNFKVYGKDAVLGSYEPTPYVTGHEICILIDVIGKTQKMADSVCSFVSSTISHHGFSGRLSTAGNIAIPFSPGRALPIGDVYEFTIWHAWPLEDPQEPFRTAVREFGKGGKTE
ncbi:MAG TPA: DUF1446 domain-containing protein [Firmicutes bacterium]|nr:DUF1446 domain-containing protein [Bacillota bacterium]